MKCEICNKEINNTKGLSVHLVKSHKYSNENKKEYYDKYLKKENEGSCYFCKKDAIFFDLTRGYHRICNSKECLGKTRSTGTYEFLMYKYNLSKNDAIKLMKERAIERGEKIKNSFDNNLIKNPNFHKEKSHQTKEYWMKRGFDENYAISKAENIMNNIHQKTWDKRRKNPDLYKDVNTTQIDYWIKKGFNKNEAKEKITERQKTFTLEKCIEKYGEIEGIKVWNERQRKWKKTLIYSGNLKCGYSKISQELFYKLLETYDIQERDNIYFATKNQEYFISCKGNVFYQYDYTDLKNKKIIEFNGDMFHANPKIYKRGDTPHPYRKNETFECIRNKDGNKIKIAEEKGFKVLVIWESEYKKDKEQTVQKCLNFLNS